MTAKLCNVCFQRRPGTGKGDQQMPQMCNPCATEGSWENTHSDANHDAILAEVEDKAGFTTELSEHDKAEYETYMVECWICHPELNEALKEPKSASTGTKAQGARRPQLNHKGHSHPQTPAARRECKKLFWFVNPQGTAEDMAKWNANLDGHGKVLQPITKPASWTVVPSGPKGGVINQLKKGKPAS